MAQNNVSVEFRAVMRNQISALQLGVVELRCIGVAELVLAA